MRLKVKALPIEDIIKDLSKQLDIPIQEDSRELLLELPENLGKGIIRGTSFENGMGIIEYQFTFYHDLQLLFSINQNHPLKFIFCSEGKVDHYFEGDPEVHTIHSYQHVIVSSSGKNGHILQFKANETVHISSIEIIRKDFKDRNNYDFKGVSEEIKELFQDAVARKRFYYRGNYSLKAADIFEEINQKRVTGFLGSMFVRAKIYEMLVLQIVQYEDDKHYDLPQVLRGSDVEKVKQAVELIQNNIDKNYSIEFIAKEVGTNVNKLQDGFKHMFHLTVNKYMQQLKLEAAKEMLGSSEYNISQIVNHIGLNNRSYFSKIFKEKYNVSPKYFLKSSQLKE
ncbi:hypothetical protein BH23BAC2_BH23BAC2_19360 [soil metagenome]